MAEFYDDIVIETNYFDQGWQKREDDALARQAQWYRDHDDGDLVGKTFRFQVADGYATYMVVQQNNGGIGIASVQVGDGYRYDEQLLALADEAYIRQKVEQEEAWQKLFDKAAS